MKHILFILATLTLFAETYTEKVFTDYYKRGTWNASGFSLSGSQVEVTREYMDFLQDFLMQNEIHSVVDVGCGDWAFSRYLDWSDIEYFGYDIVKGVITRNQKEFGNAHIHFIYGDALETDLPGADLLLCKDVFQHLPNEMIQKLIGQFHKYRHCLITNYVLPDLSADNRDISIGKMHFIDLSKPPFSLRGEKVLHFLSGQTYKQTFHIKKAE